VAIQTGTEAYVGKIKARSNEHGDPQTMSTTYIAFLRGINVGGKNKLPMKELAAIFVDAKCNNVRTYIQSGNVIFTAAPPVAKTLAQRISAQIAKQRGYRIPIVLRTIEELEEIVENNPFIAKGVNEEKLHILFLADLPDHSAVQQLDPNRSLPDAFILQEREIYLHLPNGVANSKLTNNYFDSALKTISTGRNWRTVVKLLQL
jgi:uncharacterized protein (DUF1697 family)